MSTEAVDKLKKKRTAIRTSATKLINKIDSLLNDEFEYNLENCEELQVFNDQLKEKSNTLKNLDQEIELNIDADEIESEILMNEEYSDKLIKWKGKISRILKEHFKSSNEQSSSGNAVFQNEQNFKLNESKGVKLPKLNITKFYGDSTQWLDFFSQYESAIHNNNSLSEIEKFSYLKSLLGGNALNAVKGFALTNENYAKSIQLLEDRFGRQDIVINSHMNKLLNLEPVRDSSNIKAFRQLYDECEIQIRNLESLGVTSGSYGQLLIPILSKLLPVDINLEFNRTRKNKNNVDLKELVEFIRNEIECREASIILNDQKKTKVVASTNYPKTETYKSNATRKYAPTAAFSTGAVKSRCIFCEGEHNSFYCNNVSAEDKRNKLRKSGSCYRCFRRFHVSSTCRVKMNSCKFCHSRSHHESLCDQNKVPKTETMINKENDNFENVEKTQALFSSASQINSHNTESVIYLQTCAANLHTRHKTKEINILLDNGSMKSFIKRDLADELNLEITRREKLLIYTFGNRYPKEKIYDVTNIELQNIHNPQKNIQLEVLITDHITGAKLRSPDKTILELLRKNGFNTNHACLPGKEIDIIIGVDYFFKINSGRIKNITKHLTAVDSLFGVTVQGRIELEKANKGKENISLIGMVFTNDNEMEKELFISDELKAFWKVESLGINNDCDENSVIDLETLRSFEENIKFENNRYEVRLPFKDKINIADNFIMAKNRLFSLVKRFNKDPVLYEEYKCIIENQLSEGIIEPVDNDDTNDENLTNKVYYMPHHPIIRHDKETTRLRVVFDASAKDRNCVSLNENLLAGPNLNPNLLAMLLRFRENKIGIIADIEKAFLQISIAREDRNYARLLWLENLSSEEFKIYRNTRVSFGVRASTYLLAATLKHHIKKYEISHPESYKVLNESLYVDDLITGTNSMEEARGLSEDTKFILSEANMNLRKWKTNSKELTRIWHDTNFETQKLNDYLIPIKVLGVIWNTTTDELKFELSSIIESLENRKNTKRSVLRISCKLFDPIGLISPFVIRVKILFQELWEQGLDWDEELTENLRIKWNNWCKEVIELQRLAIPRYYFPSEIHVDVSKWQLHIFCDASEAAYGSISYIRYVTENGKFGVSFITSKTRVAPVKKITLPRLELLATLIGARLLNFLRKLFNIENRYTLWSDSTIALSWIRGSAKQWKPFVCNRVSEIQTLTEPRNWRHCSGRENPADILSRGCSVEELIKNGRWWKGPNWLDQSEDKWPSDERNLDSKEMKTEERRSKVEVTANLLAEEDSKNKESKIEILDLKKYSSLQRVKRIMAWILRFISNAKENLTNKRKFGELSAEEILVAENVLIKQVQIEGFPEESRLLKQNKPVPRNSLLFELNPFMDEDSTIRVGGRLQNSEFGFDEKHPILIPSKHQFTKLLIKHCHERVMHSGVADTLSQLRENFWTPKGRQTVKSTLRHCIICQRYRVKPGAQVTASLPSDRVREASAFQITGIDFAGPLYIKDTNSKCYIALFTCAVTRAIHLELVCDLSTKSFLLAFRRFISRRGLCETIYSDNAKTFKSANKELSQLWKTISHPDIAEYFGNTGIKWKFIVERAPWWGGFWERMVRSVKGCLKKTLGRTSLNYNELETLLIEAEAVINSRPLTYVYANSNEPSALTPGHLLIGRRILALPANGKKCSFPQGNKAELIRRYQYRQTLLQHFWTRWRKEYLLELRAANCVKQPKQIRELKEGSVVLIGDEKLPRNMWKLGKVVEVFPGRDGKIRSCSVKVQKGIIRRPIQLLYPFEMED